MRYLRFSVMLAALVVPATVAGAQRGPEAWDALTGRLERVSLEGTLDELRALRTDILRVLVQPAEKPREPQIRYVLAYVSWRMASRGGLTSKEQADLLNEAVTHLQTAIKSAPNDGESYALLGAVYSQQISADPSQGMVLGARSAEAFRRSAELTPNNPRLATRQGVSAFFTPPEFGGSLDEAERLLRRSLALFTREAADTPWPNWGRFDAHVWLGQVLARRGDRAGAKAEYDEALALAPGSTWVSTVLIPQLQTANKR